MKIFLIPLVLVFLPIISVLFIWYLNLAGLYYIKLSKTCLIDSDCPPGYMCINGKCVRA